VNKKALPIVVAVAVVAILMLVFSITRNLRGATELPMPAKPRLADQARQHFLQRGNPPPGTGMPAGTASPAPGAASGP